MTDTPTLIANALIDIGAVGFRPDQPITFKSGIIAPVYVDNRKFPFHPKEWRTVIEGFQSLITEKNLKADVIAGIETAGIPHSSALGYVMRKPSVFVRKKLKDHGTQIPIEGGEVSGMNVVLIEDLISTGSSSLHGVDALRAANATLSALLAIVGYDFKEAADNFGAANVTFHTLTTFPIILAEAVRRTVLSVDERTIVEDWFADPHGWANRRGIA